jgi:hypothetical protein
MGACYEYEPLRLLSGVRTVRARTSLIRGGAALAVPALVVGAVTALLSWPPRAAVRTLQVLVVRWGPAPAIFRTADLAAAAGASSVLGLEEARKLVLAASRRIRSRR